MKQQIILFSALSCISAQDIYQSANEVINGFNDRPIKNEHITEHLLDIARNGHQLDSDHKSRLEELGFNFDQSLVTRGGAQRAESIGLDKFFDIKYFRIHYTTSGRNAVSSIDLNSNNIPDYIDSLAEVFENVSEVLHEKLGFNKPPGDGFYTSNYDNGGSDKYDIYIRQLASNFYGYVQFEQYAQGTGDNENTLDLEEKNAITSYMAMRNSYQNFNQLSEIQNIQTTIAHEFFHAVQLGYDGWEKQWLLEATAVWMEEELFDEINDVYQYMPDWFRYPHRSLDEEGTHAYGSYIFFEYIEQNMGGNELLRKVFEYSAKSDSRKKDGSHLAIDQALKLNGYTFKQALNSMSIANKIMSSSSLAGIYRYEEADKYPIKGPNIYKTLNFKSGTLDFIESTGLNRYGSQYISITSRDPVLVEITKINGSRSDLKLNAILEKRDNSYLVISNDKINIDPINLKSISLSVISEDTLDSDLSYRLTLKDGTRGTGADLPLAFTISHPYPNPFKNEVTFSVTMLQEDYIRIDIFNLTGRKVKAIHHGKLSIGKYDFKWDSKNKDGVKSSSGSYFIKVSNDLSQEWKMISLIK